MFRKNYNFIILLFVCTNFSSTAPYFKNQENLVSRKLLVKFKNILRILPGSRPCETIIFSGCLITSEFFMIFNYSYFFTPSSLILCKSIF